jgi:hypothetical protein
MKKSKKNIIINPRDLDTFEYMKTSKSSWVSTGDKLILAARMLETEKEYKYNLVAGKYRDVYDMLIAFALENYYKGAIEARLSMDGRMEDIGKLRSNLNHNLVKLAIEAGVNITDKQKGTLKYLSECALWRGRYPIPTSPQKISSTMHYTKNENNVCITGHHIAVLINESDELINQAKENLILLQKIDVDDNYNK